MLPQMAINWTIHDDQLSLESVIFSQGVNSQYEDQPGARRYARFLNLDSVTPLYHNPSTIIYYLR